MSAQISIVARGNSGATEHKGKTVESIVRRLYGAKATFRISQDRNSPEAGLIVTPAYRDPGGYNIQARVFAVEGDREVDE